MAPTLFSSGGRSSTLRRLSFVSAEYLDNLFCQIRRKSAPVCAGWIYLLTALPSTEIAKGVCCGEQTPGRESMGA